MKQKFLLFLFLSCLLLSPLNGIVIYLKNSTGCEQLLVQFDTFQTFLATGQTTTLQPPDQAIKFGVSSNCADSKGNVRLLRALPAAIQGDATYVVTRKNISNNPAVPNDPYELELELA